MTLKKKDFQKLVNFIKEFQSKLPCGESSAELRDSLNLSLLHMHKFYKRSRIRCHNGGSTLDGSISLSSSLTGAASPISPFIAPIDRFDWRWLSLDAEKLSASFGHGDKTNFVPEIFYVIKDCEMDQLKKIIDEDEDSIHEMDAIGRTTAMYATNGGSNEYLECLKFLIDRGADLQHQSNDGFTCLHIACFFGYQDFVEVLLQAKVDVNAQDSDGRTPLHFAAAYCTQDILQMLIIHGADPSLQDSEGLNAVMWACHFDQLENLQLLLALQEKSNFSPEARFQTIDNLGRTILHWAVSRTTNINCMKFLLNAETAQLCDDEGKTIFLFAAEHGCIAACEEILSQCADDILEDTDNAGRTALHLAAMGGHGEVVDFLLSRGAASEREDSQGASPVDLVTSRKLHYCNLVFASYQRYRDRLESMNAKLSEQSKDQRQTKLEKNVGKIKDDGNEEKEMNGHVDYDQDYQATVQDESGIFKERSNSVENKSLKIDCQDAVGFEIEGDIEEEDEFDVLQVEENTDIENRNIAKNQMKKSKQDSNGQMEESLEMTKKIKKNRDGVVESKQADGVVENLENVNSETNTKKKGAGKLDELAKNVKETDIKTTKNDNVDTGANDGAVVDEPEVKDEVAAVEEQEIMDNSDDKSFGFRDVSFGLEDQKIVLVAHHEGGDGFEIDDGDDVNDLEFQDDEEDEILDDERDISEVGELTDGLKVDAGQDRDLFETSRLSPRIESVTGLMETNTMPANQSASVNMSVSSLRSDSEDEDAVSNVRERTSKLDSKLPIPIFDERPVNQLEFRDPFTKTKPLPQFDEAMPNTKRYDDGRPKTSHSKRKDKDAQKSKKSSPKGKQGEVPLSPPRLPLGALEPMKPLQPIIPPQGFPGSRGGSQGQFPGNSYEMAMPTSPRSPLERSNALSSPVESPRSKGSHLPSPRSPGFEARESTKLSHIPRPSSPSSRERHLPPPGGNHFAPRPPIGR